MDNLTNEENPPLTSSPPPTERPRTRPGKSLLPRPWVWVLVLCLLGAGAWYYFSGKSQSAVRQGGKTAAGQTRGGIEANRPTPVATATAKSGDINIYLNGLGTVTPLNTVTVRSRVEGELNRILFREGQVVKQGELLAEIDPRAFQVQLAQAEGQMARDVALLKNAQADLERYRVLFEQDSIARQQLDTQQALVRQYEGTLKADQAQIDNAKLQLVYSRITAPISGRIGLRQVDPGNIVRSSDTNGLAVITQLQPVSVIFTLPEDNLPAVMKKLQAGETLAVDAFDRSGKNRLAGGVLLTVDNQIDPATGTVKLKAQFPNDDHSLFANQFVNARMLLEVRHDTTLVPAAAVQRGTQGSFVYVVKNDSSVTVRPIKPGPTEGETAAIEEGLAPGEVVVIDGTDKLREGAKVEVAGGRDAAAGAEVQSAGKRHRKEGNAGQDIPAADRAGAAQQDGGEPRRRREGAATGTPPAGD
ncbi:MAG TPA: MdtA/MuxA family multidrug efflux RND transporter periplasmic adaptor subunit [Burkholderiales bacterium]